MSRKTDGPTDPLVPAGLEERIEAAREAERAGDYDRAQQCYEDALGMLCRSEHAPTAVSLLRWTGTVHRKNGDGDAANDCYEASLAVAELIGDRLGMAHALNAIASVQWEWGNLDSAASYLQRARELAQSVRAVRLLAMLEQNLGIIANIRGDVDRAIDHYEKSLVQYRQLGERDFIAQLLNNIGMIRVDLEQWDQAEALFEEAGHLSERAEDFSTRIMVETNRTELFILKRDFTRALQACNEGFALATRYDHHRGLGEVHKNYGVIYRERGEYRLAEMHLKKASQIAEQYSNLLLAGEVQREIARVYRALDRNQEALRALNYAHRVFTDLEARVDLADVGRRITELEEIFLEVVRKWGESIESKDRYTAGHCERVADYSCMLAETVGFDEQTMTWFRMGAFLHDVGKTMVPPDILNKKGDLSDQEWAIMRQHTVIGEDLLSAIDFPWDVRPMIRGHHERWDGNGYPDGLEGREIPLSARILCIADVFDALTTTRSYRGGYSIGEALDIMAEDAGSIFDPELFERFRALIEGRTRNGGILATAGGADGESPAGSATADASDLADGAAEDGKPD